MKLFVVEEFRAFVATKIVAINVANFLAIKLQNAACATIGNKPNNGNIFPAIDAFLANQTTLYC